MKSIRTQGVCARVLFTLTLLASLYAAVLWTAPVRAGEDWPAISKDELQMKENPAYPGASAMILYREERTDDMQNFDTVYYRTKIFTDAGKKYADIEIPFRSGFKIGDIRARTVHPDGSIVNFSGQVFEKVVAKASGLKVSTKTFTLPDVTAGSIIEYRFRRSWDQEALYNTNWTVQEDLFTKRVSFSLKPYNELSIYWTTRHLPPNTSAAQGKDKLIHLDIENIPPFPEEEFMPPKDEMKMSVRFYYTNLDLKTGDDYWKAKNKAWYQTAEQFIGKRKAVADLAAQTVAAGDTAEVKLRKLYSRVQQIRNLSAERSRTEKEASREKLKENQNTEDVLKRGYGSGSDINWLFIGMARAAGFDASVAWIAARDEYFFNRQLLDGRQLNVEIAVVHTDSGDYYLDPGQPFCPFGLLVWAETSVAGLKLGKDSGTWITTPTPKSSEALVERKAKLSLDAEGNLQGSVEVSFSGQEALLLRSDALDEDDTGRTKMIEDRLKGWLPNGAKIESLKVTGWQGTEEPLRVECTVKLPSVAVSTGRRLLLGLGLFEAGSKNPFDHSSRIYPVYFEYPYMRVDDITLDLPRGYQLEDLPATRDFKDVFGTYRVSRERQGNAVRVRRQMSLEGFIYPVTVYPNLRSFFSKIKAGDDEQAVLQAGQSNSQ